MKKDDSNKLISRATLGTLMGALCAVFVFAFSASLQAEEKWKNLFNGANLDGWAFCGGVQKFYVEDGTIVGEAVGRGDNGFLCIGPYYNFELELEVKLDGLPNSGVQIRSALGSFKDYLNMDRICVMGPQVEITVGNATGAIFGEHCGKDGEHRGWIVGRNLVKSESENAFKPKQWNRIRIVANGPSMKTWVNGVATAAVDDEATNKPGFICLQVHMSGKLGEKVRFRNIRIRKLP